MNRVSIKLQQGKELPDYEKLTQPPDVFSTTLVLISVNKEYLLFLII